MTFYLSTKLIEFIMTGQLYPEEELKEINDTNGMYFISSFGRVLSICGKPKFLKPYLRSGYLTVKINGKNRPIHRLVARYYISDCVVYKNKLLVVHHKDFDKLNNWLMNLAILTKEQHSKIHSRRNRK